LNESALIPKADLSRLRESDSGRKDRDDGLRSKFETEHRRLLETARMSERMKGTLGDINEKLSKLYQELFAQPLAEKQSSEQDEQFFLA
jgi:hypothetical protein